MRVFRFHLVLLISLLARAACSQTLPLPPCPADAPGGAEFARSLIALDQTNREQKIFVEVACGNIPAFLRKLSPITVTITNEGKTHSAVYYVAPDYLAVGSDEDYFYTPLSPIIAQKVADLLHCSLPTRKMVNDIYAAATVKLVPSPIPASPKMGTVPVFIQHNETVATQRKEQLHDHPLGALVAGHKKDVVVSNKLLAVPGRVAIYGWHKPDGKPIQPLYSGHADFYADYSHGIRLVQLSLTVDGTNQTVPEVLANPDLAPLLSDEGVIEHPSYPHEFLPRKAPSPLTATHTVTNETK